MVDFAAGSPSYQGQRKFPFARRRPPFPYFRLACSQSMAADLGEFIGDETDVHPRSKRRSLAAMGAHEVTPSPLTASPMTAPVRATPPHSSLTLERPMLEQLMSPSPASTSSPSVSASSRQFTASDHDILKFAQSVNFPRISAHSPLLNDVTLTLLFPQPLARAANVGFN